MTEEMQAVTAEDFRHVIGHFASGVTVITTVANARPFGATASAVSSLSLEPPMVLVCMNSTSQTGRAISESRTFSINILSEGQDYLAARFASRVDNKFDGVRTVEGTFGQPLIADALAHIECRVTEQVVGGTHSVFIGEVTSASARFGAPLAYFRGKFGRLELTQDSAYETLREWIADRAGGEMLDLAELSRELDLQPATLAREIDRLASEGHLRRRGSGGYVVTPSEVTTLFDLHDAHTIIEIGVALRTVGRTSDIDLRRLREAMEATRTPLGEDGFPLDLDRHLAANSAFHATMVALGGNSAINELWRRADPFEMLLLVGMTNPSAIPFADLVADHEELVVAYESNDVARAIDAIERHSERAKNATHASLDELPLKIDTA